MSSLYLDHFGLSRPPFQITPDLDFFFSGGRRGDILAALLHIAAYDEGIITLVAEVGSGKTLLARLMISRLEAGICAVYLANPCFSRDEIIAAIARDLGLTNLGISSEAKLAALQQELLRRHAAGQRVLLVIDEAHAMPVESLEEVRLLSNLETGQHKLVNIMLFGQPELDQLLADPRLRQVRDRVIHRFELQPLRADEAAAYVDHRLRAAGWQDARLFSSAAMTGLIKASDGRARRINLLSDKALLAAYAQGDRLVEKRHVKSAIQELPISRLPVGANHLNRWHLAGWSLALAVAMTAAAIGLLGWFRSVPTTVAAVEHKPSLPAAPASRPMRAEPAVATSMPASAVEVQVSHPASATSAPVSVSAAPASPAPVAAASSSANSAAAPVAALPVITTPVATDDRHLETILARTRTRLQQADLDGYTIQLASLHSSMSPDRYMAMITAQLDASKVYALHSVYKGKTYMSVYFGNFESPSAAASAMDGLPEGLKSNHPMLRSWSKIKQEAQP